MRFGTWNFVRTVKQTGEIAIKEMVVLKEGRKIVGFTDFNKYICGSDKKKSHKINESLKGRTKIIVKFLNYVYFDQYQIKKLQDLQLDMVKRFLKDYGLCNLPGDSEFTHRSRNTVDLAIGYIIDFLEKVLADRSVKMSFKKADLYKEREIYSKKQKKFIKIKVPVFEVNYVDTYRSKIFRDIPTDAFAIIMNHIFLNHPRILMLAANSAFAGVRPSESCNIRREDSVLGPGIKIETLDGEITDITLDLRYEFALRSDDVSVGGIKKHREQKIYYGLMSNWIRCYERYNKFNEGRKYESDYGPLSTNKQGMAITYQSYYDEFRQVVKECIPQMLASDNPEVVQYGNHLAVHHISPHILRHWFSVYLVLNGAELNDLMYWRGDKSPESSQVYLDNKSDIVNKHNLVAEKAFDFLMWRSANGTK
ncbi:MAG: site-specific integrase [Lactobacillus johnsonii]|nr:site-specific integrase [Lactobacillus johnsonii]